MSVISLVVFTVCLFTSDSMFVLWLFLELSSLALIPCFYVSGNAIVLKGLFTYLLMNGVASALIISGILFQEVLFLSVLGLMMKFGVFPFIGWVYVVFPCSNWWVIWALSTVLKAPIMLFPVFLSSGDGLGTFVPVCCCLSLIFFSFFFWVFTPSWVYYWCHVVLGASSVFLIMSVNISSDVLLYYYLFYTFWASCVLGYLSSNNECVVSSFFLIVFLLVSVPGSLVLFYKLLGASLIFSSSGPFFYAWVVYNFSEQFFLLKYLLSRNIPRSRWSGGRQV